MFHQPSPRTRRQLVGIGLCAVAGTSPLLMSAPPARAQAAVAVAAALSPQEKQATELLERGESRMKVSAYEDAITEFRNVLKRYPETEVRFQAQFRMAEALSELKREKEAVSLLQAVVTENSAQWSPRALIQMGDLYVGNQRYAEAFRAYRRVLAEYPDSPTVDRAHYAIGSTHFRLGHFEQAATALEQVGNSYASRVPQLQRVSPGQPLQLRLTEPNMVATATTVLPATISASSGDSESLSLRPEAEGTDRFFGSINTALGAAKPGDGVLQLTGSDTVTFTFRNRYVGTGGEAKKISLGVASNARLMARDGAKNEVRGVVVSDGLIVEVNDPDRDVSASADSVNVTLTTRRKDAETVTLKETGPHTGIFQARVPTAKGAPVPGNGTVETDAGAAEGSANQLDDSVTITYQDEVHLVPGATGPQTVKTSVALFNPTQGDVIPVEAQLAKADLDIKSSLYKGRSLVEIAMTYRDLGQTLKGTLNFREAQEQFQSILRKYPNAPEVEDAMYGLFQVYVEQDQFSAAVGVISQIGRKFPQSTRAPEALFKLADLHVRRREYDKALSIFQTLASRSQGGSIAETAQFAIATTYVEMLKPKPGDMGPPKVTADQVTTSLEEFARNYPESDKAPNAMWQLAQMRFEARDFRGTVDTARRMGATYPDNELTGRVLLMQGQSHRSLNQIPEARNVLGTIIANYGGEAEPAQKILGEIDRKFGARPVVAPAAAPKPVVAPAASKPAATKPAATKPAATKPAATKPAASKPAPKR